MEVPAYIIGLSTSDVNADGNIDLVVSTDLPPISFNNASNFLILLGDGTGSLNLSSYYNGSSGGGALTMGDFNSDGRPDVVKFDSASQQLVVYDGVLPSDLTVTVTHGAVFQQGLKSASYTIMVQNLGPAASRGQVTVMDLLPLGLTYAGGGGPGWNCSIFSGSSVRCVRLDPLASGASYDPITLLVNVSATAPPTPTNLAMVSSASMSDPNPSNDLARNR